MLPLAGSDWLELRSLIRLQRSRLGELTEITDSGGKHKGSLVERSHERSGWNQTSNGFPWSPLRTVPTSAILKNYSSA